MAAYRLLGWSPLQQLHRTTAYGQLGLELGDALLGFREFAVLGRAQPGLQAAVDTVLAAPVVDRLVAEVEVVRHGRDTAALLEQVEDLAPVLG